MNGTVTCIVASYCTGIGVYRNPRQQSGESQGAARNGQRYRAICWANGLPGNQSGDAVLDPVHYNPSHPASALWIKIPFAGGEHYIPWIWFNLDAYDSDSGIRATLLQC
jgi:hypothetical protein